MNEEPVIDCLLQILTHIIPIRFLYDKFNSSFFALDSCHLSWVFSIAWIHRKKDGRIERCYPRFIKIAEFGENAVALVMSVSVSISEPLNMLTMFWIFPIDHTLTTSQTLWIRDHDQAITVLLVLNQLYSIDAMMTMIILRVQGQC